MNQQFQTPFPATKKGLPKQIAPLQFASGKAKHVSRQQEATTTGKRIRNRRRFRVPDNFTGMHQMLTLLVFLLGLKISAQVNLGNGLVGWYTLQGNANDNSGSLNHGVSSGGVTYVADQWSASSSAARFGGTGNPGRIAIPNSSSLQFTTGASFACWFRLNSNVGTSGTGNVVAGGNHCLFTKDGDAGGGLWCTVALNGTNLNFSIGNVSMTTMNYTSAGYTVGTWLHVAYIMDAGIQRLYINGTEVATSTQTSNFGTMNNKQFCMGRFGTGWYPLNGDIDEFRIYNRAINNTEVAALSSTDPVSTTITGFSPNSICAGQSVTVNFSTTGTPGPGNTYYLQLSDATGSFTNPTTIGTLVSSANTGSITGTIHSGVPSGTAYQLRINTDITPSTGAANGPLTISSIIGDMVSSTAFTYLGAFGGNHYYLSNTTSSFATARATSASNNGVMAGIHSASTNNFLKAFINSNTYIGYTDEVTEGAWIWEDGNPTVYTNWAAGEPNNSSNQDYAQMLPNGQWDDVQTSANLRHFMMLRPELSNSPVCTGSALTLIGPGIPGATYSWSGPNGFNSTDQSPVISPATFSHAGTYTLTISKGGCSESFTTTVVITQGPSDINQNSPLLSSLSNGLILHYPMNGNASDNSGNASNGTIVGGVTATTDRFDNAGQALSFNGSNGHIDVPDGTYFNGGSFSVSVWVKLNTYASWSRIFDFGNGPANNNVLFSPTNGTSGKAASEIYNGTVSGGQISSPTVQTGTGKWQHLVYTFESGTGKILLNGVVIAQGTQTAPQNVLRTICYIGRSNWTTDTYINGSLDDFRLYDRALTTTEIQSLYLQQPDNLLFIAATDTICVNTSTQLLLLNSQPGVSYQLRDAVSSVNIGATQTGNGDTLVFDSGNVSATTTFELVATVLNSGCSIVMNPGVQIVLHSATPAPIPTNASVCNEGSMTISVNSSAGSQFNWYAASTGGTPITTITGNSYTTPVIDETLNYYVSVTDTNGCEGPRVQVTAAVINPLNPPVDIVSGLILHYKFDGNLADSSGNGYNATIFGTNNYVSDRNGNPLSAINSTASGDPGNNYISAGNPLAVQQLTNQVTISMWIRQTQTWFDGGGQMPLINKWNGSTGMWVGLRMTNPANMQNRVRWRVNGTTYLEGNTNVPVGQWHHVVCTYNGTQLRIYQNGVLTGTLNSGGIANTAVNLLLGRQANGTPVDGITYRGDWDEVKIYNRALNGSEVQTLFNNESVAFATTPLCDGEDNLTLTTFDFPGATYQWSGPNGFNSTAQNPAVIVNADSATYDGLYTLLVTNNGCTSPPQEVDVTINGIPLAPATINDTVCGSGNAVLTASGAPVDGTYNWYTTAVGGSPINGQNGPTLTINNLTVTTIRYVSISRFGCEGPRSMVTAVYQNPVNTSISVSGSSICANETTASVTIPASENGVDYQAFTGGTAVSSSTAGGGSITLTINASLLNTGANSLTIYATRPGCGAVALTNQPVVTINALPVPVITADGPLTFCSGGNVNLTASSATSYLWNNGSTNASVNVTTTGTYSVTVTDGNGCAGSSAVVSVTVDTVPVPFITPSGPLTFCPGGNVTLTASGGSSYLWSNGDTNPSVVISQAGSYSVQVTSGSCTALSSSVTVNLLPAPTATITANGPLSFCDGGNVILNTDPASSYLWSDGQQTPSITVSQNGNYSVTVTDANGCSGTSAPVNVIVHALPDANFTASSGGFCTGVTSLQLSANDNSLIVYDWYKDGSVLALNGSSSIAITTVGTYELEVTDANGCSAISTLSVQQLPDPVVNIIASSTSFCEGSSVPVTADFIDDALYQWFANGNPLGAPQLENTVLNANSDGDYSVLVTTTQGCTATSNSVTLTENALPVVTVSASALSFCSGESAVLTATAQNVTFQWYFNGNPIPGATGNTLQAMQAGNYTVEVNDGTCSATSAPLTLTVNNVPASPSTISGSTVLCSGYTDVYSIAPVNGATGYTWTISPANAASISQGQGTTSVQINSTNQNFTVSVTAENACGSSGASSIAVGINSGFPCDGEVLFAANQTAVCVGSQVVFTNYTNNAFFPGLTPQWNFGAGANPATASGNGPHTVTYTSAGLKTVTLSYTDQFGFVVADEIKTNYISVAGSVVTSSISGNTVLPCIDTLETYSVTDVAGSDFQWTVPNGAVILSGQGTHEITVDFNGNSGSISVVQTNQNGCEGAPVSITITIGNTVSTGSISGPTVVSCSTDNETYSVSPTVGSSYQWSLPAGAVILSGQGSNSIQVDFNANFGQVTVVETNNLGCTGNPQELSVDCINGVTDLDKTVIMVSPNPFTTGIKLSGDLHANMKLLLYNEFGQLVIERMVEKEEFIDLSALSTGFYTGVVTTPETSYHFKLVKAAE